MKFFVGNRKAANLVSFYEGMRRNLSIDFWEGYFDRAERAHADLWVEDIKAKPIRGFTAIKPIVRIFGLN